MGRWAGEVLPVRGPRRLLWRPDADVRVFAVPSSMSRLELADLFERCVDGRLGDVADGDGGVDDQLEEGR